MIKSIHALNVGDVVMMDGQAVTVVETSATDASTSVRFADTMGARFSVNVPLSTTVAYTVPVVSETEEEARAAITAYFTAEHPTGG
jgi:hypothetical protein